MVYILKLYHCSSKCLSFLLNNGFLNEIMLVFIVNLDVKFINTLTWK